jgi:putative transposase
MEVNTPKKKRSKGMPSSSSSGQFDTDLLDQLLGDYQSPEDLVGAGGVLKQLTAALINRAMEAEMSHHLGYDNGEAPPDSQSNRRNGRSSKKVRTEQGEVEIEVPRDRDSSFEPAIVAKHQRSFRGFDDKILAMYARGMSTREIQSHLHEIYGVEVSPDLVSRVTDAVEDELESWRKRPLEPVYLVVYIDALMVKTREQGQVASRAIYTVMGIDPSGQRSVLGLWAEATEGAKYWLSILEELKHRGVRDIFILCADGLTGLPQACEAAFPKTVFQTCIVHMVRSSTRYVSWKDRKKVCADLRKIYSAIDADAAEVALDEFEATWGDRFPMVAKSWRKRWNEIVPFLAYPPEIRRAVYTTNAVESLHRMIRKVIKTKGHFPSDKAALKLTYMVIRNAEKTWGRKTRDWAVALQQFAIYFEERMPL